MSRIKLLLTNFFVYGFGGAISKLIPLIMVPVITRLMPNSFYYGLSDLSTTIVSLFTAIAIMGMYDAMYRMFFEKKDEEYQKDICSSALVFTIITSTIVSGLMFALQNPISKLFYSDYKYGNLVMLCALSVLLGSTNSIVAAPTRMQNKKITYIVCNTLTPIISYSIAIPLIINGHYLIALPLANLLAVFSIEIIFILMNHKWFSLKRINWKYVKLMLIIALPLMPNFIIYWIFNSSDRVMISNLIGADAEGVYAVATKIGHISQLIYTAFAGGWQYFAFSIMRDEDNKEFISKVFDVMLVISLATCLLGTSICKFGVEVLFKEEYWSCYICIPYLYLSPLLLMLFQIGTNQFLVIKKTWPNLIILSIGAILNIILNLLLIPTIGIEGASIATFIGYFISIVLCLIVLKKYNLICISIKTILAPSIFFAFFGIMRLNKYSNYFVNIPLAIGYILIIILLFYKDLKKFFDRRKMRKMGNLESGFDQKTDEAENQPTINRNASIVKDSSNSMEENSNSKKERFFGIDLLKILLFVMVVCLHVLNPSIGKALNYANGVSFYILKLLQSFSIVAVNCFMLISGFLMCRKKDFSIKRVLFIYIMYFSYNLICYFLDILIFKDAFTFNLLIGKILPKSFFINFYCVILFISPLLNKFFLLKSKIQFIYLLGFTILFVVFPTFVNLGLDILSMNQVNGLSFITMNGEAAGYNLIMFILMYLIGGFINMNFEKIKVKYPFILGYLALTGVIMFASLYFEQFLYYDNLLVCCSAICLFIFFSKLKIKHGRILPYISSCSLGVYILHITKFVIEDIYSLFKIENYIGDNLFTSILYVMMVTLVISFGCATFDFLIRLCVKPVKNKINKLSFIDKKIIKI